MNKNWILPLIAAIGLTTFLGKKYIDKMKETQLSKNFKLGEFMVTKTGLPNVPSKEAIKNITFVVNKVLQPLRDYLGIPITITSGFRSEEVNHKVGGSQTSQHKKGEAVDFVVGNLRNSEIVKIIQKMGLPYDQLLDEELYNNKGELRNWIHLSLRRDGKNRGQYRAVRNTPTNLKPVFT